jgi:hypothetical protein
MSLYRTEPQSQQHTLFDRRALASNFLEALQISWQFLGKQIDRRIPELIDGMS